MNIYVGNIPYKSSEDDLGHLFSEFGDVTSVKIIQDKFTGRSKGFGFVTMSSDAEANEAIEKLDNQTLDGREIKVSIARPPKQYDNAA